jgi:hypothetical protein
MPNIRLYVGGRYHEVITPSSMEFQKTKDHVNTKTSKNVGNPLNYLVHMPAMSEKYLNIIYDMAKKLPKGCDVTDLFGGVGLFPKVMWELLQPHSWECIDLDVDCREYFQEPRAKFTLGNAYDARPLGQIVFIDTPNGTLRTIADNMDGRLAMYRNIQREKPDHLIITDFGYYWIHLPNHHPWYEQHFGEKPTRERYHLYWDKWFSENIGYKIANHTHGAGSGYYHMIPV